MPSTTVAEALPRRGRPERPFGVFAIAGTDRHHGIVDDVHDMIAPAKLTDRGDKRQSQKRKCIAHARHGNT
jgi:hypothetical protein